MQMRTTAQCSYLEGGGVEGLGALRYIALYQSADTQHGRAVYCLLLPSQQRGVVVVVQPSVAAAHEVTGLLLERSWKETMDVLTSQGDNTQEQVRLAQD